MESYGIKMKGKFILEKLNGLPAFDYERDRGRLVYDNINKQAYFGAGTKGISVSSDRLRMTEHENKITQNESDISTLTNRLSDHIGSTDEHPAVTQTEDGFMSDGDKTKLDSIDNNANDYSLEVHGNDYHTEDLLTSMGQYELNSLSDVSAPSPSTNDSLVYDGSNGIDGIGSNVHTVFNQNGNSLSGLKPGYKYLVIMEYICNNQGTGWTTLYRPRLVDSSGSTLTYGTTKNVGVDWPDGNYPRTSPFIVTAPGNGYVRMAGGSRWSSTNAIGICIGKG